MTFWEFALVVVAIVVGIYVLERVVYGAGYLIGSFSRGIEDGKRGGQPCPQPERKPTV